MSTNRVPIASRVLVITASFPPDGAVGALRTLRLVKHLARTGADAEVLTLSPWSYRAGTVTDPATLSQVPADVRVLHAPALRPIVRVVAALRGRRNRNVQPSPSPAAPISRPVQRFRGGRLFQARKAVGAVMALPDQEVSWIVPAILRGLRRAASARPDVILSSGPPFSAHVVGAVLGALMKRPWVADFRDPWARAPWREDRFEFERRAWAVLERLLVTQADAVLFVTCANRDDFAAQYGDRVAARFHVVPNGCDTADFDGITPGPAPGRFVLLHAGSLYGARDPSPLFRAVAEGVAQGAIDPDRFRIRLVGRVGIPEADLPSLVRTLRLEQVVEFLPHMPRSRVLQQMVDASALLVVQPVTKLSVPGKLYEYLATGRPVLALAEPDGETAAVLGRTSAGMVVSPSDHAGILRAITTLIASKQRRVTTDPSLYDGALRAAEMAGVLWLAASPLLAEPAVETVPISTRRP